MSDIRSIAQEIVARLNSFEELRGKPIRETFKHPSSNEEVENGITIPVRLLRRLEAVLSTTPTASAGEWPAGATVKLKYIGWQADPNSREFGWARRNAEGRLVALHSGIPLDVQSWGVVEERSE